MAKSNQFHYLQGSSFPTLQTIRQVPWKLSIALFVIFLVSCHGQTFQYSRGWTNGKRVPRISVPSTSFIGTHQSEGYEMQNPVVGMQMEENSVVSPTGSFRLGLSRPQGRLRSFDYPQFLNRKLSGGAMDSSSPNKKLWMLGIDPETTNNDEIN